MSESLKSSQCAGCSKLLKKITGLKKTISNEDEAMLFSSKLQRTIIVNDILCSKCRLTQYKEEKLDLDAESTSSQTENDQSGSVFDDPVFKVQLKSEKEKSELERIEIPIQRTVSTHKYCCVCFETKDLTIIPEEART